MGRVGSRRSTHRAAAVEGLSRGSDRAHRKTRRCAPARGRRDELPDRQHPPDVRDLLPAERRAHQGDHGGHRLPLRWLRHRFAGALARPRSRRARHPHAPSRGRGHPAHRGCHRQDPRTRRRGRRRVLQCGELPHRRVAGHARDHGRGPRDRRLRRLGPRACRRQCAHDPPRLGRRLRGLVLLQVPQLRAGLPCRLLHPRAARPRHLTAAARRVVGHALGSALPYGTRVRPPADGRCVAGLEPPDLRDGSGPGVAGGLRRRGHGFSARAQPAPHRLPS